jgi:hypothetical protein
MNKKWITFAALLAMIVALCATPPGLIVVIFFISLASIITENAFLGIVLGYLTTIILLSAALSIVWFSFNKRMKDGASQRSV